MRFRITLAIILLLGFGSSTTLQAQVPFFSEQRFPNEYQGLKIRKFYQDASGIVWIGTSSGIFQYTGHNFIPYQPNDSFKKEVTAIYEDQQKRLWVGYYSGEIAIIKSNKISFFNPEEGLPKAIITSITSDNQGNLWFGTYGEGIYYYKDSRLFNINLDDGLKDNSVYELIKDSSGRIWAGTDRGIAICEIRENKKIIRTLTENEGLPDNIVTSIYNKNDTFYIGTQSAGVCIYDLKAERFYSATRREWDKGAVTEVVLFNEELWLLGNNNISILDKKSLNLIRTIDKANAPFTDKLTALMMDNNNNLWIGQNSSDFYLVDPQYQFINLPENSGNLLSVLKDRNGNVWYGTESGLKKLISDQSGNWKIESALPIRALALYEDRWGYLWIGGFEKYVYRIETVSGKIERFSERDGIINTNVLSITGKDQEIWFSTLGGVSKCVINSSDNKKHAYKFQNFDEESGLGTSYIYKVFIDKEGKKWFATDGKGITVYNQGKFRNFSSANGLISNTYYSITQDVYGNMWFSTPQNGIYKYNGEKFTYYGIAQGLRDLNIGFICADRSGNILIAGKSGIDILNINSGQVLYHDKELGIEDFDPNINAYYLDKNGTIWCGGKNRIIKYQSIESYKNLYPQLHINSVQVFLKPVDQDQNVFAYNKNHVSFEYLGIWYHNPQEVRYRLKLLGYDREWINSRNHFITYPNLPPGKYIFMVQASASNDFSKAPLLKYEFTIKPPFWRTLWFYVLSLLFVIGGIYWYIKNREKKLKLKERTEKDKVAIQYETLRSQVNPHFLFNSFNTLISIIEKDKDSAIEYVEKLSDFYRDLLMYRSKDVIQLSEEIELINRYFYLQQKRYKDNLQLLINLSDADLNKYIAPLSLQLLVENAIKHNVISKAKPLAIEIYVSGEYIVVKNNLQRKTIKDISTGIGLTNLKSRYKILTGKELKITENNEYFSVSIPLIK